MSRLPPLNAIRAFEAAGRLGSIVAAAQELSVTPAAVSQQVKTLEDTVKVQLFARGSRGIALTEAGRSYLKELSRHIAGIRQATDRLVEARDRRVLRVQVNATFALRWLIPKLADFHARHPDTPVSVTTSIHSLELKDGEFDFAIQLGAGDWKGMSAYRLVENHLEPACSPSYAKKIGLDRPASLCKAELLHAQTRPDDWLRWLRAHDLGEMEIRRSSRYESSVYVYQAAVEGQGVALAQKVLVDSDVRAGRLIYPFDSCVDMGSYTYYLVEAKDRSGPPHAQTFRDWLIRTAGS